MEFKKHWKISFKPSLIDLCFDICVWGWKAWTRKFFLFTFGIISSSNNPILWFRTYLYFSILRTVLFNSEISFSLLRTILSRDLISFLSSSLSFSRLDILVSSLVRSWEREVRLSFCSSRSFWDTTCFFFKIPSSPRNLNSSKVYWLKT